MQPKIPLENDALVECRTRSDQSSAVFRGTHRCGRASNNQSWQQLETALENVPIAMPENIGRQRSGKASSDTAQHVLVDCSMFRSRPTSFKKRCVRSASHRRPPLRQMKKKLRRGLFKTTTTIAACSRDRVRLLTGFYIHWAKAQTRPRFMNPFWSLIWSVF